MPERAGLTAWWRAGLSDHRIAMGECRMLEAAVIRAPDEEHGIRDDHREAEPRYTLRAISPAFDIA
jgi:hypothetical protein